MAELRSSEVLSLVYGGGKGNLSGGQDTFTMSLQNTTTQANSNQTVSIKKFEKIKTSSIEVKKSGNTYIASIQHKIELKDNQALPEDPKINVFLEKIVYNGVTYGSIEDWDVTTTLDETDGKTLTIRFSSNAASITDVTSISLTCELQYIYNETGLVYTLDGAFNPIKNKKTAIVKNGQVIVKTLKNPKGYFLSCNYASSFERITFYSDDKKFQVDLCFDFSEGTWYFDIENIKVTDDSIITKEAFYHGSISFFIEGMFVNKTSYDFGDNKQEPTIEGEIGATAWPNIDTDIQLYSNKQFTLIEYKFFTYIEKIFTNAISLDSFTIIADNKDITEDYDWKIVCRYLNSNTISLSINNPIKNTIKIHLSGVIKTSECKYGITFNTNRGTTIEKIEDVTEIPSDLKDNDKYKTTRAGHTFVDWYLDSSFIQQASPGSVIDDSIILYAKWNPGEYKITFNYNYKDENNNIKTEEMGPYSAAGLITVNHNPKRSGYLLKGWNEKADGSGDFIAHLYLTTNLTLYAIWEEVEYNISFFTYEGDSKTPASIKKSFMPTKTELQTELQTPTREAYDFIYWCSDATTTTETNYDYKLVEDVKLYAKWEKKTFLVQLNLNKGQIDNNLIRVSWGEVLLNKIKTPPIREGYKFEGWYWDSDFNDKIEDADIITSLTPLIHAKWLKCKYTVSIDLQGGIVSTGQTLVFKEVDYFNTAFYNRLPEPTKKGHNFTGWEYNGSTLSATSDFELIANIVLYAKWEPVYYTVTFNYGNPDPKIGDIVTKQFLSGEFLGTHWEEKYGVPGYEFKGWFTDTQGQGTKYEENTSISKDITLYAYYNNKPSKVVIHHYNEGLITRTLSAFPETKDRKETENDLVKPYKAGNSFKGWVYDSPNSEDYIHTNDLIVRQCHIYPVFEPIIYIITVKLPDGTINSEFSLTAGSWNIKDFDTPPLMLGYDFEGYFKDQEYTQPCYGQLTLNDTSLGNPVNYTLYIKLSPKEYNLQYIHPKEYVELVEMPKTTPYKYIFGETIDLSNIKPTAPYRTFDCWYEDINFTKPILQIDESTRDIWKYGSKTLYSNWKPFGKEYIDKSIRYSETIHTGRPGWQYILAADNFAYLWDVELDSTLWKLSQEEYDSGRVYYIYIEKQSTGGIPSSSPIQLKCKAYGGTTKNPCVRLYENKNNSSSYQELECTLNTTNEWEFPSNIWDIKFNENTPWGYSLQPNSPTAFIKRGESPQVDARQILDLYAMWWRGSIECKSVFSNASLGYDGTSLISDYEIKIGDTNYYLEDNFSKQLLQGESSRLNMQFTGTWIEVTVYYWDNSNNKQFIKYNSTWLNETITFNLADLNEINDAGLDINGEMTLNIRHQRTADRFNLVKGGNHWTITITINKQGYNPLA